MASSKVAELFVEITTKGLDAAKAAMSILQSGATTTAGGIATGWGKLAPLFDVFRVSQKGAATGFEALAIAAKGATASATAFAGALSPVTGFLLGMVRSGIQASSAGQVLEVQMAELSRQMASLFVPQISWVIRKLGELVSWFQRLSGEQQAQLRQWGLTVGVLIAVGAVLPRIVASFQAMQAGIVGARIALAALTAHPLMLLATVLAAAALSVVDLKTGMNALKSVGEAILSPFQELLKTLREIRATLSGTWFGNAVNWALRGGGTSATPGGASGGRSHLGSIYSEGAGHMTGTGPGGMRAGMGASRYVSGWFWQLAGEEFRKKQEERLKADMAKHPRLYGSWAGKMGMWFGGKAGYDPRHAGKDPAREGATPPSDEKKKELHPRLGGFEAIEATYNRIARASIMTTSGFGGKTPEEESLDLMKGIGLDVGAIAEKITGARAAIVD